MHSEKYTNTLSATGEPRLNIKNTVKRAQSCPYCLGTKQTSRYKYVQLAHAYFGGSPKYVSKWISVNEEEINAVNEGRILLREEGKNYRYLYKKKVSSATTIGYY